MTILSKVTWRMPILHKPFFILQSVHFLYKYAIVKKVGKLVIFKQKGQKQASFLAFHKCCQGCLLRVRVTLVPVTYLSAPSAVHRPEKLVKGSLFCLFLKLVQINFIFTDNVRILYMYFFLLMLYKTSTGKIFWLWPFVMLIYMIVCTGVPPWIVLDLLQ
jgi:hypothetical protein